MASPATENWWSSFLDAQGRDSEEEAAFNGYLTTREIPAWSDPGTLQQAYAEFRQFMEESEHRQADLGPSRAELVAQQAVAELEHQFMPKSRVSAVGVEKPKTAATRPSDTREPLAESGPGPEGQANVAPASGEEPPQHPQVRAGSEPPDPMVTAGARPRVMQEEHAPTPVAPGAEPRAPDGATVTDASETPAHEPPESEARGGRFGRRS